MIFDLTRRVFVDMSRLFAIVLHPFGNLFFTRDDDRGGEVTRRRFGVEPCLYDSHPISS